MTKPAIAVSFRLDVDTVAVLDDYCQRTGLTRGTACRTLVVNSLAGGDDVAVSVLQEEILRQIKQLQAGQAAQRRSLAYLLFTVLTEVGQRDAQEAADLVRRTFARCDEQGDAS